MKSCNLSLSRIPVSPGSVAGIVLTDEPLMTDIIMLRESSDMETCLKILIFSSDSIIRRQKRSNSLFLDSYASS